MAGYIGSKAAVTQADGYTKTEADGRYVEGDDTLYVDQTNNRVGVGTSSPNATLDVADGTVSTIRSTSGSYHLTAYQYASGFAYLLTNGQFEIGTSGANILAFKTNNTERMRIDSSGLLFSPPTYSNTSGGSSNVGIGASGEFYRSTSSRKYKNTINDATHGLAELLTLRPVTYKGNSDGDTIFGGLIAEEVHEAGLAEFVQYAEDGSPDALSYSNMVALCIKAIQEQQAKIETLETKVAALEAGE